MKSQLSIVEKRAISSKNLQNRLSFNKKLGSKDLTQWLFKRYKTKKNEIILELGCGVGNHVLKQAKIINSWGKNVYVKIPVVNSKGLFSGKVINKLSNRGMKLNITAVYTVSQVAKILKVLNKKSKTIISIFSG